MWKQARCAQSSRDSRAGWHVSAQPIPQACVAFAVRFYDALREEWPQHEWIARRCASIYLARKVETHDLLECGEVLADALARRAADKPRE